MVLVEMHFSSDPGKTICPLGSLKSRRTPAWPALILQAPGIKPKALSGLVAMMVPDGRAIF